MKKIIVPIVLSLLALTLIAQPVLAVQSPMMNPEPVVVNQVDYDGEDKVELYLGGFIIYFSQSTCATLGSISSVSGLGAFLLSMSALFIIPTMTHVAIILFGLGITFWLESAGHQYGIKLYFRWIIPMPIPILFSIQPQSAPPSGGGGGGGEPHHFL